MKKMFPIVLLLAACSNGRNELTTSLLNERKSLEDSAKDALNFEHYYYQQAKEKMHDADTNLWKRLSDTSVIYSSKGREYAKRIKDIDFSIDSLSKMK